MHAVYTHVYRPTATCFTTLSLYSIQDLETPELKKFRQRFLTWGKGSGCLTSWSCFCFNVTIYKGTWQINPPMMFWFVFCCPFIDCLNNTFYWIKSYHHLGGNVGLTIIGFVTILGFATVLGFVEGSILGIFWWPKHEVETLPGSQVAMMWTHHPLPRTNQPGMLSPPITGTAFPVNNSTGTEIPMFYIYTLVNCKLT